MARHIVLDTETTGLDPRTGHRLIEIACVEVVDYMPTGRSFHEYVHPDREIDPDAERVHGISLASLHGKPRFPEIVERFLEFVGDDPIVAHNAPFDRGFVNAELDRCGFAPTPATKGGLASMALNRATSGGASGWAPFVFVNLGGTDVANEAYMLGIADASPGHIVLRKGALSGGLPDVAPGTSGVIWRSDEVVAIDEWAHIRLMVAGNANGDAVITCWRSDLAAHAITSPTWVAIAGQRLAAGGGTVADTGITDDGAGIITGSPAFTSGYMGYGVHVSNTARVALVDGFACEAQP